MQRKEIGGMACLVLTAMIWGFAFVSQVQGMASMSPLFFGATRFTLGALSLIPLLWFRRRGIAEQERRRRESNECPTVTLGNGITRGHARNAWATVVVSVICGIVLFTASTVQQYGILYSGSARPFRLHHGALHRHDAAARLPYSAPPRDHERHRQRCHRRGRLLSAVHHRRIRLDHPCRRGAVVHCGSIRRPYSRHRHVRTEDGSDSAVLRTNFHHRAAELDRLPMRRLHRLGRRHAKLVSHRVRRHRLGRRGIHVARWSDSSWCRRRARP